MDSLGLRVHAFQSAMDFLSSGDIGNTSCMIADVPRPHMSGSSCITAWPGHAIPTVLITAYRSLAGGVVACLIKAFDQNALVGCVHAALQRRYPGTGTC